MNISYRNETSRTVEDAGTEWFQRLIDGEWVTTVVTVTCADGRRVAMPNYGKNRLPKGFSTVRSA